MVLTEVADRLARLALHHTYKKSVVANGPVAIKAVKQQNILVVTFSSAKQLSTLGSKKLTGFELVNDKGIRMEVVGSIDKNKVIINIPTGEKIKRLLYAWKPFSRANLVNEAGLPAATFSMECK